MGLCIGRIVRYLPPAPKATPLIAVIQYVYNEGEVDLHVLDPDKITHLYRVERTNPTRPVRGRWFIPGKSAHG